MKRHSVFILCITLCLIVPVRSIVAATYSPWRFWTIDDGLKEPFVRSISLNPDGKLLAVHRNFNVISYLDGWGVRTISFPGTTLIHQVKENPVGRIWTIHPEGLFLLQDSKNSEWQNFPLSIKVDCETPFVPFDRNTVLILTKDRFVRFDVDAQTDSTIQLASSGEIGLFNDLILADNGAVWIGAEKGIAKWTPNTWEEYRVDRMGYHNVRELVDGGQDNLYYVSTANESETECLIRFDGASYQVLAKRQDLYRGWPKRNNGFFVNMGSKIWTFDNNNRISFEKEGVLSGRIRDVAPGQNGDFFIATSQGIARFGLSLWNKVSSQFSDLSKHVRSIHEDSQGRMWFACDNAFCRFRDNQWEGTVYLEKSDPKYDNAKAIYSLSDGRIILNIEEIKKIVLFDLESESFELVKHPSGRDVEFVTYLTNGTLLAHTIENGYIRLEQFDETGFRNFLDFGENAAIGRILGVHQTKENEIWIGGTNGLIVYGNGVFRDIAFPGETAVSFLEFDNGRMWVGGKNNIFEFNGSAWRTIRKNTGPVRLMMTAKDGSVWIASGKGLYQVKGTTWLHYSIHEGLPSNIVHTVFEDRSGKIWAGTTLGLCYLEPLVDTDSPETIIPKDLNFDRFAPDSDVRIVLSGVDKWKNTLSDRLLFSSKIDGGNWQPFAEMDSIVFPSLPPGPHRLETRAMDRNWNIDTTPAVFEFTVLLPWYREPLVIGIAFLSLIFLLALVIMTIVHTAKREKLLHKLLDSQNHIKTLRELLPICSHCKKVRDDKGYWNNLEEYLKIHHDTQVSHGICPDCLKKYFPKYYDQVMEEFAKDDKSNSGRPL